MRRAPRGVRQGVLGRAAVRAVLYRRNRAQGGKDDLEALDDTRRRPQGVRCRLGRQGLACAASRAEPHVRAPQVRRQRRHDRRGHSRVQGRGARHRRAVLQGPRSRARRELVQGPVRDYARRGAARQGRPRGADIVLDLRDSQAARHRHCGGRGRRRRGRNGAQPRRCGADVFDQRDIGRHGAHREDAARVGRGARRRGPPEGAAVLRDIRAGDRLLRVRQQDTVPGRAVPPHGRGRAHGAARVPQRPRGRACRLKEQHVQVRHAPGRGRGGGGWRRGGRGQCRGRRGPGGGAGRKRQGGAPLPVVRRALHL